MAVAQSRFEASVNALPWINVICGISQVAAGPLQWQGQTARKQPRASHPYNGCWREFLHWESNTTRQQKPRGSKKKNIFHFERKIHKGYFALLAASMLAVTCNVLLLL